LYLGPVKNSGKALELAKTARDVAPNDSDVATLFGMASYQAGNFQQAYNVLQSAVSKRRDDPTLLHAYAWAAYSVGRVPEAEVAMQSAAVKSRDEKISTDAKTFLTMIALERSGPDSKTAEPQVTQVLGVDPNYLPALMVQAAIQSQQGDAAGAAAVYNRILERFPDFAPAQKQLAALYATDPANQKKAYELAINARKTLAEDAELARTLARLSYGRKEYRRVIQLFQESQKQKPLDSISLFYLGMAQAQLNEKTAARDTLQKALAAGLPEPTAAEAKRVLTELDRQ
jgi:tetratricopeptide (TPR) repeat protein